VPLTLRDAEDGDREAIALLVEEAFRHAGDPPLDPGSVSIDDRIVVADGGRVRSSARICEVAQWWGGASVPTGAVRSVMVAADSRGAGVSTLLLQGIHERHAERGLHLSVLFPSVAGPYRHAGYELAGDRFVMSSRLEHLPPAAGSFERVDDLDEVRHCYDRWAADQDGAVDRPQWWWTDPLRVVDPSVIEHVYGVREAGELMGYAVCQKVAASGRMPLCFDLDVRDAVWRTPGASRVLLGSMRAHAALGEAMRWPGRPGDHWCRLIPSGSAQVHRWMPWMLRVVDVEAALTARGYAEGEGSVSLTLTGGASERTIRLSLADGRLTVEPAASATVSLTVQGLASLFSGYVGVPELARDGALRGDARDLIALGAIFPSGRARLNEYF
jgi:predicted acetyltransferase